MLIILYSAHSTNGDIFDFVSDVVIRQHGDKAVAARVMTFAFINNPQADI